MKNKTFIFFASFIFLLAPGSFEQVLACTCSKADSSRKAFDKAKAIFVGKAVGAAKQYKSRGDGKEIVYDIEEIYFEVEEAFKGVKKGSRVTIYSGRDGDLCGYMFEHGETYLVYGDGADKGNFSTDICTRTSGISKAKADLNFLRRLPPKKSGAKTFGYAEKDFTVQNDGSISGKVVDADGKPVERIRVELLTKELINDKHVETYDDFYTNEDGSFAFKTLSVGDYFLAVNYVSEPGKEYPYPTIFYPYSLKASEAAPIRIERGKKLADIILRLPPRLVEKKIYGSVFWQDGSPASETEIELHLEDTEYLKSCVNECITQTDAQGKVVLTGYLGRTYRIRTSGQKIINADEPKPFPELITFKANNELPEFKLILRKGEGTTNIDK